jgi:hypothetical protein
MYKEIVMAYYPVLMWVSENMKVYHDSLWAKVWMRDLQIWSGDTTIWLWHPVTTVRDMKPFVTLFVVLSLSSFSGSTAVRRRNTCILNPNNKCREWSRITISSSQKSWWGSAQQDANNRISNTLIYKIRCFVGEDSYCSGLCYDTALPSGRLVLMFLRNTLLACFI